MACKDSEKKCFTFTWRLENASYCLQKKGKEIKSPAFQVAELQETKWNLWFYPRGDTHGNYVSCYLNREADGKGESSLKILYELAFMAADGSILDSSFITEATFFRDKGFGYNEFVERDEMFAEERSKFLPQDTLTVRCRIWKSDGGMAKNARCSARTRIGVLKTSFLWNLEDFSALELEKKYTYRIKSPMNDMPIMSIDLFVTGGVNCDEIIRFELSFKDKTIRYSVLRLYLVAGNREVCYQDEFWLDDGAKSKQFSFFMTRKQLIANKSLYLPDDVLSLHWEWAFSKGIVLEEIEDIQHGCPTFERNISHLQKINNEEMVPLSQTLNNYLKSLYDERFLCDIKLKTSTSEFPAHKIILSAFSTVFKAMFSNDMKEKDSNCVNINDLSDDAVCRMLVYIYTARMEDLTWETASHLYVAADK